MGPDDLRPLLDQPTTCVVRVDGAPITELYPLLQQVRVTMSRTVATECTLTLDNLRDEAGQWVVQRSGLLRTWRPIEIIADFGGGNEQEVMRGYIRQIDSDYPQQMGQASVRVTGQDESLLLDREHIHRRWSEPDNPLSDGAIAREAVQSPITVQAEEGLTNTDLVQNDTTYRFLRSRAEANGFELYFREQTLFFGPPQLEGDPLPTIMLYAGRNTNCLELSVAHDGHRPVEVRIARSQPSGSESDDGQGPFTSTLPLLGSEPAQGDEPTLPPFVWQMNPRGASMEEARSRAQAAANENAWRIRATGELDGALYRNVLLTHRTVNLDGAGDTEDGAYYVDSVTHSFTADGYRQQFTLIRNATGRTDAPVGATDRLGGVTG